MPRPSKRTTIRDLAEDTGLSPAAVSYALRGLQVSAETERRVREAADRLGYEVDPIARALRGGATGVVGLIVGSLADFWHQSLVAAVQAELRMGDRHTLVADADGRPDEELALARRLVDQRVDGLIASPIGARSDGWDEIARAVPTVTVGDTFDAAPVVGEVAFDNDQAVGEVLRHLHALGHRRVDVLSWAIESAPGRPAERAVLAWAERLGLRCRVVACAYSLNGSRPLAVDILRGADPPTAVLCLSDSIAYGVYVACRELGLRIPDDVSVVGFDDHPVSRLLDPALTSVDWGIEQIASTATELLLRALAGEDGRRRELVAPRLRPRASTAPPRTA